MQGYRRRVAQADQFVDALLQAFAPRLEVRDGDVVRCSDHQAGLAIDNHFFAVAHVAAGFVNPDHGRNAQTARQDRGVGKLPAGFGNESADTLVLHVHGIRWRQVISHQDAPVPVLLLFEARFAIRGVQRLLDAPHDVFDVVFASTQISIVHRIEDADDRIALLLQRPLGIATLRADDADRAVVQHRIIQHEQMRFDKRFDVARCIAGNHVEHRAQLRAGRFNRRMETLDFLLELGFGQPDFSNFRVVALQNLRLADAEAARYADAVEHDAHALLSLAEARGYQFHDLRHRFTLVAAVNVQGERAALTGGQHHYAHDAFAVYPFTVLFDFHFGFERRGEVHEFGGGPGMQAQLVYDFDVLREHSGF